MSKLLSNILKHLIEDDKFVLKNSFEFKEKIETLKISENESMVSFDIVSLFTNIPTNLAIQVISEQWDKLKEITNIPRNIFFKMLRFTLVDANYFSFNNVFYSQIYGMPMGNPLSSIIADIVTNILLCVSLNKLPLKPSCFFKYVDYMFTILPTSHIESTLTALNNFHPKLKFTAETETNGRLAYLDILVIRNTNNTMDTDWYRKNTTSTRILNYYSNHPNYQKFKHRT